MSEKAACWFLMGTMAWDGGLDPNTLAPDPKAQPDWYKQLKEKGYTTEELFRTAMENGYEFTEEEFNKAIRQRAHLAYRMFG